MLSVTMASENRLGWIEAFEGVSSAEGEVTHHSTLDLQSAFQSKVSQVVQYISALAYFK